MAQSAFVAELGLQSIDVALRRITSVLGATPRLVERRELGVAGLGVVVALLLTPVTVEGGAREPEPELPAHWAGREQRGGEQLQV